MDALRQLAARAGLVGVSDWLAGSSTTRQALTSAGLIASAHPLDLLRLAMLASVGVVPDEGSEGRLGLVHGVELDYLVEVLGATARSERRDGVQLRLVNIPGIGRVAFETAPRSLTGGLLMRDDPEDLDTLLAALARQARGEGPASSSAWFEQQGVSVQADGQKVLVDQRFVERLRSAPGVSLGTGWGDVSGQVGPHTEMPNAVRDEVEAAVRLLTELDTRARRPRVQLSWWRGDAQFPWDAAINAVETIAEFRKHAPTHRVDAKAAIEGLGGLPRSSEIVPKAEDAHLIPAAVAQKAARWTWLAREVLDTTATSSVRAPSAEFQLTLDAGASFPGAVGKVYHLRSSRSVRADLIQRVLGTTHPDYLRGNPGRYKNPRPSTDQWLAGQVVLAKKAGLSALASWMEALTPAALSFVRLGGAMDAIEAPRRLKAVRPEPEPEPEPPDVYHTTEATRRRANVAALRVLRAAQSVKVDRGQLPQISAAERHTLRQYSGMGGIDVDRLTPEERTLLTPDQQEYLRISDVRKREIASLQHLRLTGKALEAKLTSYGSSRAAFMGMVAQYFTPPEVAAAMSSWALAVYSATGPIPVPVEALEPSAGIGRFMRGWEETDHAAKWTAVEMDPDLADMLRLLFPDAEVFSGALEQFLATGGDQRSFDLVVANPPYAKRGKLGKIDPGFEKWGEAAHYFMVRTATALRPHGVMLHLTPSGVIRGTDPTSRALRLELLETCHLFGAVQPPADVFPGADIDVVITAWGKRPNRLPTVLPEDEAVLAGKYFDDPRFKGGIMGRLEKRGRHQTLMVVGEWNPDVMRDQPLRTPHRSYNDAPGRWAPTPVQGQDAPSPVGSSAGLGASDAYAIGEKLGWRVQRLQNALAFEPEMALAAQPELHADLVEYVAKVGNPHADQSEAAKQGGTPAWRALLSVVDPRTGALAPVVTDKPVVRAGYQGEQTPEAAALHLCARRGHATIEAVADLLGRDVSHAELALAPRLYLSGLEDDPDLDLVYLRREEALTGALYPRIDWTEAAIAGRAKLGRGLWINPTTRPGLETKLRQQLQEMNAALPVVPIGEIDLGIRTHWMYDRPGDGIEYDATYLREWMVQEYRVVLDRARVEHGFLLVEGDGALDPRVQAVVAYFNRVESFFDSKGDKKKRQKEDDLADQIAADRQRDEQFRMFIRAHRDAEKIAARYNRAFGGYVPRTYSEEPIPLARLDREKLSWVKPYQWAAIRRGVERLGGIESLDVGLGKTLTMCLIMAALRERGEARRFMFAVPNTVGPNWLAELAMWLPDFRVVPIGFSVQIASNGAVRSTKDSMATVEKKLRAFAAGAFDCAVVQQSTFRAFGMDPDNVEQFYERQFSAQREGSLAQQAAIADERKVKALEAELATKTRGTKVWQEIRDRIDKMLVYPWIDRLNADAAAAKLKGDKKAAAALMKQAEAFGSRLTPTERQQATDQQKFEEWVAKRIKAAKIKTVTWEQLGVDVLAVDEGHEFKNLYGPATRYGEKPKYMGAMGADQVVAKCWDMWAKCAWLRSTRKDTGVYFLTATPLKNSPLEAFNLLSYVTDVAFRERGLLGPEDFIERYCQGEAEPVLTIAGGFASQLAVKTFTNLHELRGIFEAWVDVKVAVPHEEYDKLVRDGANVRNVVPLNVPPSKTELIQVPMTATQMAVYEEEREKIGKGAQEAAEGLCKSVEEGIKPAPEATPGEHPPAPEEPAPRSNPRRRNGRTLEPDLVGRDDDDDDDDVEEGDDASDSKGAEILKAMDRMQKAALDSALLGLPMGQTPPKFARLADGIAEMRGCSHIIFCDYSEAYPTIMDVLHQRAGVPRDRMVAVKGSKMTPGQRQDVARRINGDWSPTERRWVTDPEIDIVIGGVAIEQGINLQRRNCAIWHLTLPWEPASIQQRNGRGVRQGNWLAASAGDRPPEMAWIRPAAVRIFYVLSERSFDGYKLTMISGKREWMRGLLESADRSTNNPGASMSGPCAQLTALAADEEKAKEFCRCLEKQAAVTALARRQEGAAHQFGKLVELRYGERIANNPDNRARFKAQADLIERTLAGLPDEVFARKGLLPRAADVPIFLDHKGGRVWIQGGGIKTGARSELIELVDPRAGTLRHRPLGVWTSTLSTFGQVAEWKDRAYEEQFDHAADIEALSQARLTREMIRDIRPDVFKAREAAFWAAIEYQAVLGRSFDYMQLAWLDEGGYLVFATTTDARGRGITSRPLMPHVPGDYDKLIDGFKRISRYTRERQEYTLAQLAKDLFNRTPPRM